MKKSVLIIALIALIATSCSITQSYHFNENFSGTSRTEVDLGTMIQFMAGMDSTGEDNSMDTLDQTFAEVAEVYRNLGAKNIDFGWNEDSTVLFLSYDFDNVETINKILQEDKESDLFGGKKEGSKAQFTVKGKNKLIYEAAEMEEDTTMSSDEMESMKEYYQYKLAFSFEKDIKKMKNENAVMSPDGKSFEFSGSMFDILSEDYSTDFTVKLK